MKDTESTASRKETVMGNVTAEIRSEVVRLAETAGDRGGLDDARTGHPYDPWCGIAHAECMVDKVVPLADATADEFAELIQLYLSTFREAYDEAFPDGYLYR